MIFKNFIKVGFMQLTKQEYNAIKLECNFYENNKAVSIIALKIIQKTRGWVSDDAIKCISEILNIPIPDIEGVATFYNQIFRQPVGRNIIRYCDSVVCYMVGCDEIRKNLEDVLKINIGNTTPDKKFTLLPTCCLGMCNVAPVIMINETMHSQIIPASITKILELYI